MSSDLAKEVTTSRFNVRRGLTVNTSSHSPSRGESKKSELATPKGAGYSTLLFSRKKSLHVPRAIVNSGINDDEPADDSPSSHMSSEEVLAKVCHQATPSASPAATPKTNDSFSPKQRLASPNNKGKTDLIDRMINKFTSAFSIGSEDDIEYRKKNYLIGRQSPAEAGKPCLVLDLDETLVHSSFKPTKTASFVIPVVIEGVKHHVYVHKRPYVDEFLRRMSEYFELVVFTASLPVYANPLLDVLDSSNLVRWRLYREHCTYHDGSYVKDLSRVGRAMNQILLVDNATYSYGFQPRNGFSSRTFIDEEDDFELRDMADYLERIHKDEDLRHHTRAWNERPRSYGYY